MNLEKYPFMPILPTTRLLMSSQTPSPTLSYFDTKLGRNPSEAPAHLSRVLYIPRHDNNTAHLPLYEAGDRYRNAVKNLPLLGSTIYTTMLGLMGKPSGDNVDDQVAWLTDIWSTAGGGIQIRLNKRELGMCGPEIQL